MVTKTDSYLSDHWSERAIRKYPPFKHPPHDYLGCSPSFHVRCDKLRNVVSI